jgi:hypothetical protein
MYALYPIFVHSLLIALVFWPHVFPTRLTWLSVIFQLVGGGNLVVNAMIFAMVSDVTPEEKR